MGIKEILEEQSVLIDAHIAKSVPREKDPWTVYKLIWDFLDRGGKRFRPVLAMLSCEAVGGDPKKILPAATAIEVFHNFTLIHDDIEDDSQMRRGKPCVHLEYGIPLAVNAGDGLLVYSWKTILDSDLEPETALKAHTLLVGSFIRVLEGQGIELGWHRFKKWDMTSDDYINMIKGKTGKLISASCELGAFLGGGTKEQIQALKEFGMSIGISFQIQDDVLNLIGTEEKYKKEIGGDITEGKRTLMVIYTLNKTSSEEKNRVINILDSHTTNQKEIKELITLMQKYGAIKHAQEYSKNIVLSSKEKLEKTLPESKGRDKLLAMADFFINRDF